jgi:hypothetical protein
MNKNGSKKFTIYPSCDTVVGSGKISQDGMYTIHPSESTFVDQYCRLKTSTGNPFPTASLSVDFTTGK